MNSYYCPRLTIGCCTFIVLLNCLNFAETATQAAESKKANVKGDILPPPTDLNELSMEVNVLRTLYLLRGSDSDNAVGTQDPENRLKVIANPKNGFSDCAEKPRQREPANVSADFRTTLVGLRAALIAEDDARVEEMDQKLQGLQDQEDPDVDDEVELTDKAKQMTPHFIKQELTADQVVYYLHAYDEDLPNPRALLFKAMRLLPDSGVKPSEEEWQEIRAFTIREVTWQLDGLNEQKEERTSAHIGMLLDEAHALSDADIAGKSMGLRNRVKLFTSKVGPAGLLDHVIQHDVAELLSNPRLLPAIRARLQYLGVKNKQQVAQH